MSELPESLRFEIARDQAGQRLDRLVAARLGGLGRSALKRLFARGAVQVASADGRLRRAAKGDAAVAGQLVLVDLDGAAQRGEPPLAVPDPKAPLHVVLERADLVVVDKPAGQATAPLQAAERGTVASALLARYPEMETVGYRASEPGLCHRLDNATSGLLLAARTDTAFAALTAALKAGRLQKRYLLVCAARGLPDADRVDLPIAAHPRDPQRVLVCRHPRDRQRHRARAATTRYRVLRRVGDHALVEARAAKAVRHQLRAHFAALGFPIHGDRLYGSTVARELGRHALHASFIGWAGDETVEAFRARSPLPAELRALLD